jgi:hypothetical protein
VWSSVKEWLGIHDINPSDWHSSPSLRALWADVIHRRIPTGKAVASLAMLISWEIWKERNARVFRNTFSTLKAVLGKIKVEARLWSLAGAKALSVLMPRE